MPKIKFSICFFLTSTFFLPQVFAANEDLSAINNKIKQQEQKISKQKTQKSNLQNQLKAQEHEIKQLTNKIQNIQKDINQLNQEIKKSDANISSLSNKVNEQKKLLEKQLEATYKAGNNSKVIEKYLNEDSQNAERLRKYYKHINEVRADLIKDLKANQEKLNQEKEQLVEKKKKRENFLTTQKKQEQALNQAKQKRQNTLAQLNKNISQDEIKLKELKENQARLTREIKQAEEAARKQREREKQEYLAKKKKQEKQTKKPYKPTPQEKQVMSQGGGLGSSKKQYNPPVSGPIIHSYGSSQMGELRWKGIVIKAPAGTAVKAIASGRVILANWLQGYGHVVVVDHGKGDMSLYGFNDNLVVNVGQQVNAGQKLAVVGNTGQQNRNALYFEIRRQGQAVNPSAWLK